MKYIIKQQEPLDFIKWKANANDDWQPTFAILSDPEKKIVHTALMKEQGYLCCYCESRLRDNDSHIEHFKPQNNPDVDPLDFVNMLCSCQNQLQKGEPRHCGNLKGGWFDPLLLVSPFDPTCETKFRYKPDGLISPADPNDQAAKETIDRLGLNIPKLIALRKGAIELFLNSTPSASELQKFVADYLQENSQGRFSQFWTTIKYLYESGDLGI
ncbi:MAG: retron system putative HNH endonuclease [Pseudanabaena sp. ELA645]